MINRVTMAVYNHSPVFIQNAMCAMAGRRYDRMRFGGSFDEWARFYAESAHWSEAELLEYQRQQLCELVRHCYEAVPYYRRLWESRKLAPGDIRDVDDLAKLPFTTKEDVFANHLEMLSTGSNPRRLFRGMTGGSTGIPLVRYFTPAELQRHYAIFWDRMRPGLRRGDRYATFQGKEIVPPHQNKPPYWRENRAGNQRLYSMRHLLPAKLEHYARSLVESDFVYYQGYVSIMTIVAEYMQAAGIRLPRPPKAVFTTSEELTDSARALFEGTWETKVWDEYCQGERCALVRQCEHGNHHPQMDYGIIEYEPIGPEGDALLAEIICTGFIPRVAPLIRYRLGDRVLLAEGERCPCGAPGPVIKAIRGRTGDYILTPDGRKYPHVSLIVDLLRNVRRTQVVQERRDEITVRIVPFPEFSDKDHEHLVRCFRERIGGDIGVRVQKVRELERKANGKVLSIINRVPGQRAQESAADD